jgi:hypothetical protein
VPDQGRRAGALGFAIELDHAVDAGSVIMMVREVPVKFPGDFLKAVEAA